MESQQYEIIRAIIKCYPVARPIADKWDDSFNEINYGGRLQWAAYYHYKSDYLTMETTGVMTEDQAREINGGEK